MPGDMGASQTTEAAGSHCTDAVQGGLASRTGQGSSEFPLPAGSLCGCAERGEFCFNLRMI